MHTNIGLWIDHRRAVIVFPSKLSEETSIIVSQAERHQRRAVVAPRLGLGSA